MEFFEGKYINKERGFGFVQIDGKEKDIFIGPRNKKGAMNNDIVQVKVFKTSKGESPEGRIIKIVKRCTNEVVGTFIKSRNFGFVIPDDKSLGGDIFISKAHWKKAKTNQKVVVEVTKYPENKKKAEGVIKEILGYIDEAGVDMLSIVKEFKLPNEFTKDVLDEAIKVSKEEISIENRLDLRDQEMFTIDGDSAKDLDDAVFVEQNDDDTWTLGVCIADVSHYVREGSVLNREAITRGTSVYMLDRVIPMLPKELSNGICSLNQHEDRYSLVCIMKVDNSGRVVDSEVKKAVINVTRRMSYHEVYAIINRDDLETAEDGDKAKIKRDKALLKGVDSKYYEHFERMAKLAQILKDRRVKNGYLSLDIPESEIILDENGIPVDIRPYEINFANEIIEQFMLTANETIAEKFYWLEAPFIYRVHEKPSEEKIDELNKFLYTLGYRVKGKKDDVQPKAFAEILDEVKGKDEEKVVSNLILRTLKIAKYEAENKGHFGIASKYYCHFTSPIRRYPDLFIHRVISKYIDMNYDVTDKFKEKYQKQAEKYSISSSDCEQIATKAERESEDMKKAEFMESKIGEEYEGIVSNVTNFGMFVELPSTIEGLVRFENLGKGENGYFICNEAEKTLQNNVTGKIYRIGQRVKVRVIDASKILRKINFEVVE